jgi:hypothetical protein
MEAADELLTQHHAIEESLNKIAEHARRRRITAITGALVVALGCIVALLAMMESMRTAIAATHQPLIPTQSWAKRTSVLAVC